MFIAGMAPAVVLWNLWVRAHQSAAADPVTLYYTNYVGWYFNDLSWRDLPLIISANLEALLRAIRGLFIYVEGDLSWWIPLSCVVVAACLSGIVRLARRFAARQYITFACLFVAMLLIWHYRPTERFVFVLFPLLLAGLSLELAHLYSMIAAAIRGPAWNERMTGALCLAGLGVLSYLAIARGPVHVLDQLPKVERDYRRTLLEVRSTYDWITSNLPADATFLDNRDSLMFLYTGRRAVSRPDSTKLEYRGDAQRALETIYHAGDFAREQKVSYYYMEKDDFGAELRKKLLANPSFQSSFQSIYASPDITIYRVRGGM
jgi:hypothetical protein